MNRRDLLKLASAAALAQQLPRSALGQPLTDYSARLFALGVASGSPDERGVVLWTRLCPAQNQADRTFAVRWELAEDEGFRRIVRKGSTQAQPPLGHSVHVEVEGMSPDRWYFYRFHCNRQTSPVGRTRCFPAAGTPAARLRLAYASCQRWEDGYYAAWRHMQSENLDAVCFVGDYIYEYTRGKNDLRSHDLPFPVSLADYRARYALYRSDPDLQGMHAACPWILTWDDHEVLNNWAADNAPRDPANFLAQRAAAWQAWYENMPVRSRCLTQAISGLARGAELRIFDRIAFGDLADLFVLDTRQYRTRQACGRDGGNLPREQCEALRAPERTLLGAAQERWLADGLSRSSARKAGWSVLLQTTRFGQTLYRGKQVSVGTDGWDGYPLARQRLTDTLAATRAPNPVVLGGDVHSNWVGHVLADYDRPDSAKLGVEFTGTSISSLHSGAKNIPRHVEQNPHFVFGDGYKRGYGVVEFTPRGLVTTLRAVSDATQADSGIETLASFAVEAGTPLLHRTS